MSLKQIYFTLSARKSKVFSHIKCKLISPFHVVLCLIIFVFFSTPGSSAIDTPIFAPFQKADSIKIYVVKHSWHAGIVVPAHNISTDSLPVLRDFPNTEFIEFGWGDSAYYQSDDPGLGQTLKAGGPPTPGILHIVGIDAPVTDYLEYRTALQFIIPGHEFHNMIGFFRKEFVYSDKRPVRLQPGLYGDSFFYRAKSKYTVFYNCNHWTADALEKAGIDISTFGMFRVETLLKRLRKHGTPVNAN